MFGLFKKNKGPKKGKKVATGDHSVEARIRAAADNFLNKENIEIVINGARQRVSPMKWLYPGYKDYQGHAIVADKDKIATEIIHDAEFVNNFLQNRRDVDGQFGYFVTRVEGNYVMMSDLGERIFNVNESHLNDYDTVVLLKQAKRLLPKLDTNTLSIDLKHIEVFGDVFNKLKAKLSMNMEELTREQMNLLYVDIPTYTSTSVQIEHSIDSYYIFKLAEVLEKVTEDINSVTGTQAKQVIASSLQRIEKVRDLLVGSEKSQRFLRTIENLEKILDQLGELNRYYIEYTR